MKSNVTWQNYLNDASDAILTGESLEPIRKRYSMDNSEDGKLIALIENMHTTMVEVKPSEQFAKQLKADLLGQEQETVVWRIRKLPARVQVAAVIAAILGGVGGLLLILQRIFGDNRSRATKTQVAPEEN
jgi:hypothetical protein